MHGVVHPFVRQSVAWSIDSRVLLYYLCLVRWRASFGRSVNEDFRVGRSVNELQPSAAVVPDDGYMSAYSAAVVPDDGYMSAYSAAVGPDDGYMSGRHGRCRVSVGPAVRIYFWATIGPYVYAVSKKGTFRHRNDYRRLQDFRRGRANEKAARKARCDFGHAYFSAR